MKHTPILFYHHIGNDAESSFCSIDDFDKQMNMLYNNGYIGLSIEGLIESKKKNSKSKVFGITFDDGYEDNFINALPILKNYGFSATCFVVYNCIGKTNIWDNDSEFKSDYKLMSHEQINTWIKSGMSIGSHGLNHFNLTKINIDKFDSEILNSKQLFENTFNCKVYGFCYPYGQYNKSVKDRVINANYEYALTTKRGLININKPNLDLYALPRVPVGSNVSMLKFWLKTMTLYENY